MSKRLFANLGLMLQIAGLLTIFPIVIGLINNESQAVISLFLACVAFLGCGFLLNALCERKELDFKGSNFLFLTTFVVLPLIGALPYFYMNPFKTPIPFDVFTNGYFESVSGFTTTGFSFITNPETLPVSLLVYRSLTELMGGVGIVFLLLAFFQSKKSLNYLSNFAGIENVCGSLKKTYFSVFAIYTTYILAFTGIFYALGFTNVINTGAFVIDTITGGFQPSTAAYQPYLSLAPQICIIALMLLGSLNFAFSYNLFARKLRNAFSAEIATFLVIIAAAAIVISSLTNVTIFDSFFHVVSMSSSTGQSYLPLSAFGNTGYSILIVTMLIGGCSFSMAGGIRVFRLLNSTQTIKESIMSVLFKEQTSLSMRKSRKPSEESGEENGSLESTSALVTILLFVAILVVFAVIFTTAGVTFTDALFEVGSALTTNGISMGATTVTMGSGYKWLMIVAMTIGRVEILSILIAFFSLRKRWFQPALEWLKRFKP